MTDSKTQPFKSGYVAIVGRPNVGKSTLMNTFLRQKLAIVSPKPQTTRHRILGILNGEKHQVILLDTPGMMEPKYLLQDQMRKTALTAATEADLILLMIEAGEILPEDEALINEIGNQKAPIFLLINKIDRMDKKVLLPVIDRFQNSGAFREIVPISALKADGIAILLSLILKSLPPGEPFYPQDMVSDEPERFFVSEIIREQIFLHYGEEIPYSTSVRVVEFNENPDGKDFIRAVVFVERDSQKGILIGKGGQAIKRVGKIARENIEQFLGRSVFLQIEVRVQKKWRKDPAAIKKLGYR